MQPLELIYPKWRADMSDLNHKLTLLLAKKYTIKCNELILSRASLSQNQDVERPRQEKLN